jgi:tRNA(Ile)-lysidine synthase
MPATPPRRLADLPPGLARLCLGVGAFAASQGCDFAPLRVLVACSGGADSTALLLVARLLTERAGGYIIAAHLDHGLRPESSADARFVADLCAALDIELACESADVAAIAKEHGCGLEEAGRLARYAFFERLRQERGADVILVAHQLNDLAEDQLLRLVRGAGWPALGGMRAFDPDRTLLRPLLLTPRREIEAFLRGVGQSWRTDETNALPCATRNRMRLDVLPALTRENPAYLDAAARLWRQARLDAGHEEEQVRAVLSQLPPAAPDGARLLPAEVLAPLPAPLFLRVVKAALDALGPGQALADSLFRLEELWRGRACGKRIRFPGDKEARIVKQGLILQVIDRKKDCG